ncbi:unnamed protein product [Arctia plantaginis]|uniref:DUF4219 domain-containing protein n=1 Tax=Arctia plantaginis TaxID=874455 RepID=A0A8S1AGN3_ARCPL|nr:unnamed protein product [Arctia plantaginis]
MAENGGNNRDGDNGNSGCQSLGIITGGCQVERLEGSHNYNNWKFSLKMLLTLEGLWKVVIGEETDTTKDQRALARICRTLHSSCYQFVRQAKTSKEAFGSWSKVYEDSGLYRRVLLLRRLHRIE